MNELYLTLTGMTLVSELVRNSVVALSILLDTFIFLIPASLALSF
jgi:hypothetical protein